MVEHGVDDRQPTMPVASVSKNSETRTRSNLSNVMVCVVIVMKITERHPSD